MYASIDYNQTTFCSKMSPLVKNHPCSSHTLHSSFPKPESDKIFFVPKLLSVSKPKLFCAAYIFKPTLIIPAFTSKVKTHNQRVTL